MGGFIHCSPKQMEKIHLDVSWNLLVVDFIFVYAFRK